VVNSMDWLRVRAHLERGLIPSMFVVPTGRPARNHMGHLSVVETFRLRRRCVARVPLEGSSALRVRRRDERQCVASTDFVSVGALRVRVLCRQQVARVASVVMLDRCGLMAVCDRSGASAVRWKARCCRCAGG
jgi:hypothetical protein